MKAVITSIAYWLIVAAIAFALHIASNFAGPAGTPTYSYPAVAVIAVGAAVYLAGLLTFRRRKRY